MLSGQLQEAKSWLQLLWPGPDFARLLHPSSVHFACSILN